MGGGLPVPHPLLRHPHPLSLLSGTPAAELISPFPSKHAKQSTTQCSCFLTEEANTY